MRRKKYLLILLLLVTSVLALILAYKLKDYRNGIETPVPKVSLPSQGLSPEVSRFTNLDYAKKMILVDEQTQVITSLVLQQSKDTTVLSIASTLNKSSTRGQQISKQLLNKWGETYANLSDFPEVDGHDAYPSYSGMATVAEIASLRSASPEVFDKTFLDLIARKLQATTDFQSGTETKNITDPVLRSAREDSVKLQKDIVSQIKQLQKAKGY